MANSFVKTEFRSGFQCLLLVGADYCEQCFAFNEGYLQRGGVVEF
jgi:hypothetical protein